MSDFFEDLGKRISDVAEDIGKRAGDTLDAVWAERKKGMYAERDGGGTWDLPQLCEPDREESTE